MRFINRQQEMSRLDTLIENGSSGLAIVYGRRRIGKTRLLLEWVRKHDGAYLVADQSSPEVQRRYLAEALAAKLPGFAAVQYPDWGTLLTRMAREAHQVGFRGPLVVDELPYLVTSSPELPSILQRWTDHEAKQAGLVVALAGSSQRMMQGLVLDSNAPLYGRASQILPIGPLDPRFVPQAFGTKSFQALVEHFSAWGGVPHYWELAARQSGTSQDRLDRLVLDPLGPLHQEPDRLLIEEHPAALEVRPVLDAIGMGAHRVSEIAARIGSKATSLSRPLERIAAMGLVKREVPFGEPERKSRRSLYRMSDPFVRLWFRVVASNRAYLATATPAKRLQLLRRFWAEHVSFVWEEMARSHVGNLEGDWGPASRWWHGDAQEWDIVSEDTSRQRLMLGEVKWSDKPFTKKKLLQEATRLAKRRPPTLSRRYDHHRLVRALFVPGIRGQIPTDVDEVLVFTGKQLVLSEETVAS